MGGGIGFAAGDEGVWVVSTEVKPGTLGTLRHKATGKEIPDVAILRRDEVNVVVLMNIVDTESVENFLLSRWDFIPNPPALPTGLGGVVRFPSGVVAVRATPTSTPWYLPGEARWCTSRSLLADRGTDFEVLSEGVADGE